MPKLNLPEYVKCNKIGKNEIIRVLEPKVEVEIILSEPDCVTSQSNDGKTFYMALGRGHNRQKCTQCTILH